MNLFILMNKIAFITGITGQDGSYLAEFLLEKNYKIYGLVRRCSTYNNLINIENIKNNINIRYGDITDKSSIFNVFKEIKNNDIPLMTEDSYVEIYNLCAQSHVGLSFESAEYTTNVNSNGVLSLLECVRNLDLEKKVRIYQASTSELYGMVQEIPQKETTQFYPRSPYAVSKLYAFWIMKNYRESYGMFCSNGILFNHESPRRGEAFVTRRITKNLARILKGETDRITIGNLNAKRDWGHAKDFVEGMWLILQHDRPDDFVLSTGVNHTVRKLIEVAFKTQNIQIEWKGEGFDEIGYDINTGREYIFVDKNQIRPAEVDELVGDCSKTKNTLGWQHKYSFEDLIKEMVDYDLDN
jgi:GDPmannose 4,6-dehydratase